jgi:hypothetical protein
MTYQLTDADRQLIQRAAQQFNLRIEVLNEDSNLTDTSVDVNGTHTVELVDDGALEVCHITVIPGVRYTSNGDGWPDDVDVATLSNHKQFAEAFASAVSLAVHQDVFNLAESIGENMELAGQEEQIFS